MAIATVNPATGETLQRWTEHSEREVDEKLALAARVFRERRTGGLKVRTDRLREAARLLSADKARLGRIMTQEMGKPLKDAVAEVEKCARCCQHYAEHAERYLADEPLLSGDPESYLRYLPLGPVLAIMPWNFPFWQVIRFAAPALAAGNVGLLKHASNVPQCALALEELFLRSGFPEGAFQTLLVESSHVERIIADERIMAVTLTGSEGAGAQVAAAAGKHLKKTVLELGGSDPFIVMPSADLAAAAKTAVTARNINTGQSCIAAKRFIIHQDVYAAFERAFVEHVRALKMGDPMREETDLGPLATRSVLEGVEAQVRASVEKGARVLVGGVRPPGPGFYYPATVLVDVPEDAPALTEEVFGPVAVLVRADSAEHALELANRTTFGLGSSVWTNDRAEEERFVNGLEAGQTFINAMVSSDPRIPFGGVKRSGYGRELGALGIREFMNAKTVFAARRGTAQATRSE